VAAELHTASHKRFQKNLRVFAGDPRARPRELLIENSWLHKGLVVLKFRGVDSISDAQALVGCEIQVPYQERPPLAGGEVYVSDLIGCKVFDRGSEVGGIVEVQFGAGDAPLLVVRAPQKEHLLPFAQAYLVNIDTAGKRLDMNLPEGMLD
jgi:16S rRNA processing protein RimM